MSNEDQEYHDVPRYFDEKFSVTSMDNLLPHSSVLTHDSWKTAADGSSSTVPITAQAGSTSPRGGTSPATRHYSQWTLEQRQGDDEEMPSRHSQLGSSEMLQQCLGRHTLQFDRGSQESTWSCLLLYCFFCAVVLAIVALLIIGGKAGGAVSVMTPWGRYWGERLHVQGREVFSFRAVPFAESPTGIRRFAPPVPLRETGKPQSTQAPVCPQLQPPIPSLEFTRMSENCLHANVWTPSLGFPHRPVLVVFHGLHFEYGGNQPRLLDGGLLAARENLVVVVPNYRLGIFGFFSDNTTDAPGNVAFLDQRMAMDWVRVCASSFGGDPGSVTVLGYGAGAASLGLQLLSPAKHWIQSQPRRLLLQSGSPLQPFKWDEGNLRDQIGALLVELGCKYDVTAAKKCMRMVFMDRLLRPTLRLQYSFGPRFLTSFLPCEDAEGLALPDAATNKKLILLGNVRGEGIVLYDMMRRLHTGSGDSRRLWPTVRNELFEYGVRDVDTVWHLYSSGEDSDANETSDDPSERAALTRLLGDAFHVCPLQYFAQALSAKGHQVFAYVFSAKPSGSHWSEERWPAQYEDLPYFLGTNLARKTHTWEKPLSAKLMDLLAGFAHHGTLPALNDGSAWPPYSEESPAVVEIGSSGLRLLAEGYRDSLCRRLRTHLLKNPDNIFSSAGCQRRKKVLR
ncbi:acetylcholinesterase [Dermacentor silvarum]|uniref:acetylcholinesterase n=1 Tax=Dermacentor silvarum TaxID=543639 RepID=UPI0021007086|nr:acetylcholinesterase [Dermacentor silvarum]